MDVQELQASMERIKGILLPWQAAIANPVAAQEEVLQENLKIYTQTEYGKQHQAERISSLEDFRSKFLVMPMPITNRLSRGSWQVKRICC